MTNWFTDHEMKAVLNCYAFGAEVVAFDSIDLYGYPCVYCVKETIDDKDQWVPNDIRQNATKAIVKELIRLEYIETVDVNGNEWYRLTTKGKEFKGDTYLYYCEALDHRNPRTS